MRTELPTLSELPDLPANCTGWPWTRIPDPPRTNSGREQWPKISIVTPSYNQGEFIEETIRSVLLQGYPNLEYIVVDGGSTDDTVQVLEKYDSWIDHWVSEPDRGQSHAINKGLTCCNGAVAGWVNSDDLLAPGALCEVAKRASFSESGLYVGNCIKIDKEGTPTHRQSSRIQTLGDLIDIPGVWRDPEDRGHIVQPETLFSLSLLNDVGGLDESIDYVMDYDLWGRMLLAGADVQHVDVDVALFRHHAAQKTTSSWQVTQDLVTRAQYFARQHPEWTEAKKRRMVQRLKDYEEQVWRRSGRLARMGLPRPLVRQLRRAKHLVS